MVERERLSRPGGQDRLQHNPLIASCPLSASILRFRWLAALLVALSLIMPHLSGGASLPSLPVAGVEVGLADDARAIPDGDVENDAENGSESDPYARDYPYEIDKILALSSLPWGAVTVAWGGGYLAGPAPDPVFSFERPPKPRIA